MQMGRILELILSKGGATLSDLSAVTGVHRNYLKHYLDAFVDLQILTRIGDAYLIVGKITRSDQRNIKIEKASKGENTYYIKEVKDTGSWHLGRLHVLQNEIKLMIGLDPTTPVDFQEPMFEGVVKDLWSSITRTSIRGVTLGLVNLVLNLEKLAQYSDSNIKMFNPNEFILEISFPKTHDDAESAIEAIKNQIVRTVMDFEIQEFHDFVSTSLGTDPR